MPETYREYPAYDLALVCYSNALTDGGLIRYQAGDIVAVERAKDGIGFQECRNHLWLRVQGWESSWIERLMDSITDRTQANFLYEYELSPTVTYELARFCIPLESLVRVLPGFSVARSTDPNDVYQPFMNIDHGNLADLSTAEFMVDVDPWEWLPRIIDNPDMLATALAQLTPESTLKLERTIVEPGFLESVLDTGYFLITHPPIDPDSLIFDKFTQKYLYD